MDNNLSFKVPSSVTTSNAFSVNMTSGGVSSGNVLTGWNYWTEHYYPSVIRESYPVYIQERANDKGKQAFEIIKILQDKKLMKLEKVSDFIEAMDALIKAL